MEALLRLLEKTPPKDPQGKDWVSGWGPIKDPKRYEKQIDGSQVWGDMSRYNKGRGK